MPKTKTRTLPKPGSTFKKKFNGKAYNLSVVEQDGRLVYRLQGANFDSPSAAAKSLTNHEVNGWVFWKMDKG